MGLGLSLRKKEISDPAAAHRSAPNQMMTDGYLNDAGGRSGLID